MNFLTKKAQINPQTQVEEIQKPVLLNVFYKDPKSKNLKPALLNNLKPVFNSFLILITSFSLLQKASAQKAIKESNKFHICYFSMNNGREFKEMKKFVKKVNSKTNNSVSIAEYMNHGDNPQESFKEMIESGVSCDGLVLSGHHTGSWGGERANGLLSIGFLEGLSCQEDYYDWFNNINALWLQGCRTLGTGDLDGRTEDSNADYHTLRVGALLEVDHLEQSFAELNVEFSATLDQDNPISSRYLRVFPTATVFGWTKTSPGRLSGSRFSLPFHFAHIARLSNKIFPSESPHRGDWSKKSAKQYATALTNILSPHKKQHSKTAMRAWKDHGTVAYNKYGFNNADLNSYLPLVSQNNETLKTVHHYDCLLKNSMDEKVLLSVLDFIKEDPNLIRYTYNSVLEKLKILKETNPHIHQTVIQKLQNSPQIRSFLLQKLTDKRLGILMKIHYFAFYEEIYGENRKMRRQILNKVVQALYNIPSGSYDEIDFKQTLLNSMAKYGYLKNKTGFSLLKNILSHDPSSRMREIAVRSAKFVEEKAIAPLLQQAIKDRNGFVRLEVVKITEILETELAIDLLNQSLDDIDHLVRISSIRLSLKRDSKPFSFLRSRFNDNSPQVRQFIIQLTGDMGLADNIGLAGNRNRKLAIELLELGIHDPSSIVKRSAERALKDIGGEEALLILEQANAQSEEVL